MSTLTRPKALTRRGRWPLTLACLVTVMAAGPASANEPLFVLPTLMSLPLMAAFRSTGWSLLWVTLLEAAVLMWGQRLRPRRALLLAGGANLYSTLFGFGMVVAGVAPILLLPGFGVGAVYLARKLAVLQGESRNSPVMFLNVGAGFCLCFLSACGALMFRSAPETATVLVFATGFALTFIIEAAAVVHDLEEERPRPRVMGTVLWMNVASYAVLATTSGPALYQHSLNVAGIPRRQARHARSCVANLKQIQHAKERWALDRHQALATRQGLNRAAESTLRSAEPAWSDLMPVYIKTMPMCPAQGTYTIGAVEQPTTCSANSRTHRVNLPLEELRAPPGGGRTGTGDTRR